MPAKATSSPATARRTVVGYWQQSRRPLTALAFVLPLLALYEAGVVLLGRQAVRNGADVWLRQLLDRLGFGQYFLLPALTVGLLLAWHHVTRERWQLASSVLLVMFAECAVLGLVLFGVGRLQGMFVQGMLLAPPGETYMVMPWTLAQRAAMAGRLLGFAGAGVYEEMLFRLLLMPPVLICAQRLGARGALGITCAVVLTSVLFSAAHYLGPHGESFDAFSFWFRFTAGAFFAILFVYRGFGIAAGTHAMYDVFASFG